MNRSPEPLPELSSSDAELVSKSNALLDEHTRAASRAFKIVKRTAHLTVHVAEKPVAIAAEGPARPPRRRATMARAKTAAAKK